MSDDNVIPFPGRYLTKSETEEYHRPQLIGDRETGLYCIVVAGCVVYDNLDPNGKREAIRQASLSEGDPK